MNFPSSSSDQIDVEEGGDFNCIRQCGVNLSRDETKPGNFLWIIIPAEAPGSPTAAAELKKRHAEMKTLWGDFKKKNLGLKSWSAVVNDSTELQYAFEQTVGDSVLDEQQWYIVIIGHGNERGRLGTGDDGIAFFEKLRAATSGLKRRVHVYAGQCGACDWVFEFMGRAVRFTKRIFTASAYVDGMTGKQYSAGGKDAGMHFTLRMQAVNAGPKITSPEDKVVMDALQKFDARRTKANSTKADVEASTTTAGGPSAASAPTTTTATTTTAVGEPDFKPEHALIGLGVLLLGGFVAHKLLQEKK